MARIKVFNIEWPLQNLYCFEASARVGKKQQIGAADGSAEELLILMQLHYALVAL